METHHQETSSTNNIIESRWEERLTARHDVPTLPEQDIRARHALNREHACTLTEATVTNDDQSETDSAHQR